MRSLVDSPFLFFVSLVTLWFSAQIGMLFRKRLRPLEDGERQDLAIVNTAALTLLGLIIGFSFSMVISRYDQQPTCTIALAVSGMNDVLNSQGYTQAAWLNRKPMPAWGLAALAIFSNLLVGYTSHRRGAVLFSSLPLVLSTSLSLLVDLSSPGHGLIRVVPENLVILSESLRTQ